MLFLKNEVVYVHAYLKNKTAVLNDSVCTLNTPFVKGRNTVKVYSSLLDDVHEKIPITSTELLFLTRQI